MPEKDDQNREMTPRAFSLVKGGKELEKTLSASAVTKELKESVIPKLEAERAKLRTERLSLGLKESALPYPYGKNEYLPRSTAKEALQKAADLVGGDYYVQSKKEVADHE